MNLGAAVIADRCFDYMSDHGVEGFHHGDPSSMAGCQWRSPATACGHILQHCPMARPLLQVFAAELIGIFIGGMRQFVHEAFDVEAVLVGIYRAPRAVLLVGRKSMMA